MPTPLAAYTRVSRVGDRKDTLMSHEQQRGAIQSYANSRGLEVEFLPEENDVSGGTADRPIFNDMLRGIGEGRYAGTIVAALDRLSRMDIVDALKTIRHVEHELGAQVVSVAENFDVGTPEGRFARKNILNVADFQLDRYKLGFRNSKRSAVERGIWPFPAVPLGYTVTRRKDGGDGRLRPNPRARAKVGRGFEARMSGASWREVGRILRCSPSAAARIVENRVYLGEIRLDAGDGEVWVNPKAHQPIVERGVWEAAQIQHPRPNGNGASPPALLTGIVRCSGCSCALTPDGVRGRRYYRCRPHTRAAGKCSASAMISQPKLDEYVEAVVLPYIESLEFSAADRGRILEAALAELDATEAELDAYQQVTRVTVVGSDAFAAGMRSRFEAVEDARRKVAQARQAAGTRPDAGTLRQRWPNLSVEQRRHVLGGSLGAVFVRKGRGVVLDRIKILARGFEPADLPRHHGRERAVPRAFEWVDDIPGEVRPIEPQDVAQSGARAAS